MTSSAFRLKNQDISKDELIGRLWESLQELEKELVDELNNRVQACKSYNKLQDGVQKIENGAEFWFTCVLSLEIEPTNNRAERGLRPWRHLKTSLDV